MSIFEVMKILINLIGELKHLNISEDKRNQYKEALNLAISALKCIDDGCFILPAQKGESNERWTQRTSVRNFTYHFATCSYRNGLLKTNILIRNFKRNQGIPLQKRSITTW